MSRKQIWIFTKVLFVLTVVLTLAFFALDASSLWSVVFKVLSAVAAFTTGLFAVAFGVVVLLKRSD